MQLATGNNKVVKFVRSFTCPSCGGEIMLRSGAHALSAVCRNCSSVIDTTDERFKVIQDFALKAKLTLIPIGARGALSNITWEVIGYLEKKDKTGFYFWDEYLLFNPYHGFRFIVQMDGHWNFVSPVKKYVGRPHGRNVLYYNNERYRRFLSDRPAVANVQGEFYWQVKKGDKADTEDYIKPPYMLSVETSDGETTASMCEYLEPSVIKDAFGLARVPSRKGVYANQPYPGDPYLTWTVACFAIIFAILIHVVTAMRGDAAVILSENKVFTSEEKGKTFMSQPIRIDYAQNILVETTAAVDNQWVELSVDVSDETAGKNYGLRQAVEYYHGVSGGESWSEGGRNESDFISRLEPGNYKILYEVDSGSFPMHVNIKATRDKASWGNFWWTLLLIIAYPLTSFLRRRAFETKRWENSDYGGG